MSWTRREVARWQRTSGTSVSSHLRGIRMWRVADGPNRAARSPSLRASTCCPSAQQGHACRITNFVWTFDSLNAVYTVHAAKHFCWHRASQLACFRRLLCLFARPLS